MRTGNGHIRPLLLLHNHDLMVTSFKYMCFAEDGLPVWLELHLQLEVLETSKFWLEQFKEIPDIVACMHPEVFDPHLDHQKWSG